MQRVFKDDNVLHAREKSNPERERESIINETSARVSCRERGGQEASREKRGARKTLGASVQRTRPTYVVHPALMTAGEGRFGALYDASGGF